MTIRLFRHRAGAGGGQSSWPVLLVLAAAVLVSSGCVLWFMAAAMRNESLAVRQQLTDAYRRQMLDARAALGGWWADRMERLRLGPNRPAAEGFAALVRGGAADSVIVRDASGRVLYPRADGPSDADGIQTPAPFEQAASLEQADPAQAADAYARIARQAADPLTRARAIQGQVRCLMRAGQPNEALRIVEAAVTSPELQAADAAGRLILPNLQLLALEELPAGSAAAQAMARQLARRINEYGQPAMSSGQRLFLMQALRRLAPEVAQFPTQAAEDLAARYVEAEQPRAELLKLRPTALPGVWQMASADGRVVALLRHERLLAELHNAARLDEPLPGRRLVLLPPDAPAGDEPLLATAAPDEMPGWRLEVRREGPDSFIADAARRRAAYLWTGAAGIVLIVVLAAAVARFVGRQMTLTRLKNDLIATVSHELKTPLASMRVLIDTLLEGRYTDQKQVEEYLRLVARENQRLSRLIDNFLTFSRMERHKRAFEFAEVRVADVVADAVDAVQDRFAGPNQCLEVDVAPDLPAIQGDRDALVTVLVNLLDNAHKYTRDEKRVVLRAYNEDRRIVLEVADNGIGIPRRALGRVFERFYQADRSLARPAGGCGLGLSIVHYIVTAHGGNVSVRSEVGKGSRFAVRLPTEQAGG